MLGKTREFGILVKLIDSAIRLPVQVHPNKTFSKKHLSSNFGKTESWIILGTRENARIYFGFKQKLNRQEFERIIEKSETDGEIMVDILNEVPVKTGDVFLINANLIHAIGSGCLILEVQESTDFTIQPECWCGNNKLDEFEKYIGLPKKLALDCFDLSLYGESVIKTGKKDPLIYRNDLVLSEQLIGPQDTDCFRINRHKIQTNCSFSLEGAGELYKDDYSKELKKGSYFFNPYSNKKISKIKTADSIKIIECLLPE